MMAKKKKVDTSPEQLFLIDHLIPKVDEWVDEMNKKIKIQLGNGKSRIDMQGSTDAVKLIGDFLGVVKTMRKDAVRRSVLLTTFVEGMRSDVLEEGVMPKELMSDQVDSFATIFESMEDYYKQTFIQTHGEDEYKKQFEA
jgi:hypothetical protein